MEIHERPPDIFSRKGDDLHCRVTVPMTAAALGTRITIKALDSEETVDVRPGTQPGATLRIRGKKSIAYDEKASIHRRERSAGEFDRTLTLPDDVDAAKVSAQYRDGVLTLRLPRAESAKPRTVTIN